MGVKQILVQYTSHIMLSIIKIIVINSGHTEKQIEIETTT